jgi:sugar lactone lactonase YvrE
MRPRGIVVMRVYSGDFSRNAFGGDRPPAFLSQRRVLIGAAATVMLGAASIAQAGAHASSLPATTSPTYQFTIGTPGEAQLYPSGVGVDPEGNVYIADTGNYKVEKYAAGTDTLDWSVGVRGEPIGPAGSGNDSFQEPRDVASDGTYVYVADTDNGDVQVLDASDGSFVQKINAPFTDPIGVSVGKNASGQPIILVSDGKTGNVYVFNHFTDTKPVLTVPPTSKTEGTRDAATDSSGDIFTADYRGNTVDMYSPAGKLLLRCGAGKGTPACEQVGQPYGIDVDANNNIYVASSELEVIKVFHVTSGVVGCANLPGSSPATNTIGTKGTGPNQIFQLRRVAVGAGSDPIVYAADLWGLKILAYNSNTGAISTTQPQVGNGVYPAAGALNQPHGVALGSNYVFVTDTVNQRIERFDLDGSNPFDWGVKGTQESAADFNWAQGVGVDPVSGNVWIANTRNNVIDEFDPAGNGPLREVPTGGRTNTVLDWPMDVTFSPTGTMFIADTVGNDIQAYSVPATGEPTLLWKVGGGGTGTDQFNNPYAVAYDPTLKRLLVSDSFNSRVVSLNPATGAWNGVLPIKAGAAAGDVSGPKGIAVDAAGNIWIADTRNNRVEQFTSAGAFTGQIMGSYGLTGDYAFNAPQGLAIGTTGLLYVADAENNRIQVYAPSS